MVNFPQPGEPWKPESYYARGHRGYVVGFWIFAVIAAPLVIAAVVLTILAVVGVVPWRMLIMWGLAGMATGLAAWFRTEDGTRSGSSDFGSVPDF